MATESATRPRLQSQPQPQHHPLTSAQRIPATLTTPTKMRFSCMLLLPPNTQRQQHAAARLPSLGSACAQPQKIETSGTNSPPTLRARSLRHSTEHLHAGLSTNKPQACSSPDRRQANTAMSANFTYSLSGKIWFYYHIFGICL